MLNIEDDRIFANIPAVMQEIFGCEPERKSSWCRENQRYESVISHTFTPSALKTMFGGKYCDYEILFAHMSPNFWKGILCASGEFFDKCHGDINSCENCEHNIKNPADRKNGKKIREISVYPCNIDPEFLDRCLRIVYLNFSEVCYSNVSENMRLAFVGVFEFDKNAEFKQGSYFYKKVADNFPHEDNFELDLPKNAINIIESRLPKFIDEKYFKNARITIDETAKMLGTNRDYLSKYINSSKNKNFAQWINGLRVEYSKALMRKNPSMNLSDVAEAAGFTYPSRFIEHFTALTGIAPSKWRQE